MELNGRKPHTLVQTPIEPLRLGIFCKKNSSCAKIPIESSPNSPKAQTSLCVTNSGMSSQSQVLKRHSPESTIPGSRMSYPNKVTHKHLSLKSISAKPSQSSLRKYMPFNPSLVDSPRPKVSLLEGRRRWSPSLSLISPNLLTGNTLFLHEEDGLLSLAPRIAEARVQEEEPFRLTPLRTRFG
jgi:hypothetical protein